MIEKHEGRLGLQVTVLDEEITFSITDLNGSLVRGLQRVDLESFLPGSATNHKAFSIVNSLSHPSFVKILPPHLTF